MLISFTGYASAVTHISVIQLNSTTLQLQFQPSYALHETVSVDCYIVEVTGVGNEYISMLNSTSTVVTVFMTDPCTSYIISVTPHNVVGLGEKIIETDVIVFQGLYIIIILKTKSILTQLNCGVHCIQFPLTFSL